MNRIPDLARIVGAEHVATAAESLSGCFQTGVEIAGPVAAAPGSTEEVQEIVRVCQASETPLFTTYDTFFPAEVARLPGVLLDFRRLNRIERIDPRNLCAHIQRGVTFEELDAALKPEGLAVLPPAAGATRSVVCHAVSRGMLLAAARYPDVQVSNMQVVLANGEIHRTGSHANSEETADWKEDGGPNLSKWYLGADDIFGIVVRGSIWVYPRFPGRQCRAFGFPEQGAPLALLKELPRLDLPQECLVMNRASLARRFAVPGDGLPAWALVTGVEAFEELADYQARKIRQFALEAGGTPLPPEALPGLAASLDRPWYAEPQRETSFHALFRRVPEFDAILGRTVASSGLGDSQTGRTYVAHGLGRSVWCRYAFDGETDRTDLLDRLESALAAAGAFFDRPRGRLAEQVYGAIPDTVCHLRKIKDMMDPRRIFNPGKPVREV